MLQLFQALHELVGDVLLLRLHLRLLLLVVVFAAMQPA
jgi:hypothetical protein